MSNQRYRTVAILVFFALLMWVVACAPQTPVIRQGVSVTDALGRTVTLPNLPRRIVIVGRASFMIADAVYMFPEAPERVVAISGTPQGDIFRALVDPHLGEKVRLEREPGPEHIAAVHPDLVLMKSFLAGKLGRSVESLGIPVVYMSLETPEQYRREIYTLGTLFGDEARAEEINRFYQQRIETVSAGVRGISEEEKPTVLVLQHSTKGGTTAYKIPPLSWIQTTLVRLAGGRVAWAEATLGSRWTVITLEQVAAWDPEQIYIVDYFGNPKDAVRLFSRDPITQHLQAVRHGQVFAFPKDIVSWDQPDTRWVLGLTWLASHVHPTRFSNVDLEREYVDFYHTLYGLEEQVVRERLLPTVVGDWP